MTNDSVKALKPDTVTAAESKIISAREDYRLALSTLQTEIGINIVHGVHEIPAIVERKVDGDIS
jgi:hypothetical protein